MTIIYLNIEIAKLKEVAEQTAEYISACEAESLNVIANADPTKYYLIEFFIIPNEESKKRTFQYKLNK